MKVWHFEWREVSSPCSLQQQFAKRTSTDVAMLEGPGQNLHVGSG
jgi:hypothetical protein